MLFPDTGLESEKSKHILNRGKPQFSYIWILVVVLIVHCFKFKFQADKKQPRTHSLRVANLLIKMAFFWTHNNDKEKKKQGRMKQGGAL